MKTVTRPIPEAYISTLKVHLFVSVYFYWANCNVLPKCHANATGTCWNFIYRLPLNGLSHFHKLFGQVLKILADFSYDSDATWCSGSYLYMPLESAYLPLKIQKKVYQICPTSGDAKPCWTIKPLSGTSMYRQSLCADRRCPYHFCSPSFLNPIQTFCTGG